MARLAETLQPLAPIGDLARTALRSVGQSGGDVDPSDVVSGIDGCGEDGGSVCRKVLEWTDNQGLADLTEFLVDNVLRIVVVLAVALVVSWLAGRVIHRSMARVGKGAVAVRQQAVRDDPAATRELELQELRVQQRTETLASVLTSVTRVAVWTLAAILVLGELGVNLGPLIAGAGIVGVALGFGAQSLVKDFLSGIFMILEDQYGVGDVVDIGDAVGTVERVGLRVTELRDASGVVWYVPNGTIGALGNRSQGYGLAVADVPIPYGEDVEAVSGVLRAEAIAFGRDPEWADFVLDEEPIVAVETMTPVAVTFRVQVQTVPGKHLVVARALRVRLMAALEAAGVRPPTSGPSAQPPLTDAP